MQMMYWIILIVLAVLILVTIIATIVTIVKERKEYRKYELDEEYDIDDDYEDKRPPRKRRRPGTQQEPEDDGDLDAGIGNSSGKKRRWKIILEDTDTQEQYTYIFYDNIGIGRTTKEVAFEEFLSLTNDRKISKVHCAIIRRKDKLYLRDEGSKNHTFLNGKKIQKPIVIQREDFISLGETELEVVKVLRETN